MAINIAQLEACEDDDCEKELGKGHKFKLKRGPEIIKQGYQQYPEQVLKEMDEVVGQDM